MKKNLMVLSFLFISTAAFARTDWKGPAGTGCEFDLKGKHYTGVQYETGGGSGVTQGWGCRSGSMTQSNPGTANGQPLGLGTSSPVRSPKRIGQ